MRTYGMFMLGAFCYMIVLSLLIKCDGKEIVAVDSSPVQDSTSMGVCILCDSVSHQLNFPYFGDYAFCDSLAYVSGMRVCQWVELDTLL